MGPRAKRVAKPTKRLIDSIDSNMINIKNLLMCTTELYSGSNPGKNKHTQPPPLPHYPTQSKSISQSPNKKRANQWHNEAEGNNNGMKQNQQRLKKLLDSNGNVGAISSSGKHNLGGSFQNNDTTTTATTTTKPRVSSTTTNDVPLDLSRTRQPKQTKRRQRSRELSGEGIEAGGGKSSRVQSWRRKRKVSSSATDSVSSISPSVSPVQLVDNNNLHNGAMLESPSVAAVTVGGGYKNGMSSAGEFKRDLNLSQSGGSNCNSNLLSSLHDHKTITNLNTSTRVRQIVVHHPPSSTTTAVINTSANLQGSVGKITPPSLSSQTSSSLPITSTVHSQSSTFSTSNSSSAIFKQQNDNVNVKLCNNNHNYATNNSNFTYNPVPHHDKSHPIVTTPQTPTITTTTTTTTTDTVVSHHQPFTQGKLKKKWTQRLMVEEAAAKQEEELALAKRESLTSASSSQHSNQTTPVSIPSQLSLNLKHDLLSNNPQQNFDKIHDNSLSRPWNSTEVSNLNVNNSHHRQLWSHMANPRQPLPLQLPPPAPINTSLPLPISGDNTSTYKSNTLYKALTSEISPPRQRAPPPPPPSSHLPKIPPPPQPLSPLKQPQPSLKRNSNSNQNILFDPITACGKKFTDHIVEQLVLHGSSSSSNDRKDILHPSSSFFPITSPSTDHHLHDTKLSLGASCCHSSSYNPKENVSKTSSSSVGLWSDMPIHFANTKSVGGGWREVKEEEEDEEEENRLGGSFPARSLVENVARQVRSPQIENRVSPPTNNRRKRTPPVSPQPLSPTGSRVHLSAGDDTKKLAQREPASPSYENRYTPEDDSLTPVRKSRRANRGQKYQALINEGIIQPSKERLAVRNGTSLSGEEAVVQPPQPLAKTSRSKSYKERATPSPRFTGRISPIEAFDFDTRLAVLPLSQLMPKITFATHNTAKKKKGPPTAMPNIRAVPRDTPEEKRRKAAAMRKAAEHYEKYANNDDDDDDDEDEVPKLVRVTQPEGVASWMTHDPSLKATFRVKRSLYGRCAVRIPLTRKESRRQRKYGHHRRFVRDIRVTHYVCGNSDNLEEDSSNVSSSSSHSHPDPSCIDDMDMDIHNGESATITATNAPMLSPLHILTAAALQSERALYPAFPLSQPPLSSSPPTSAPPPPVTSQIIDNDDEVIHNRNSFTNNYQPIIHGQVNHHHQKSDFGDVAAHNDSSITSSSPKFLMPQSTGADANATVTSPQPASIATLGPSAIGNSSDSYRNAPGNNDHSFNEQFSHHSSPSQQIGAESFPPTTTLSTDFTMSRLNVNHQQQQEDSCFLTRTLPASIASQIDSIESPSKRLVSSALLTLASSTVSLPPPPSFSAIASLNQQQLLPPPQLPASVIARRTTSAPPPPPMPPQQNHTASSTFPTPPHQPRSSSTSSFRKSMLVKPDSGEHNNSSSSLATALPRNKANAKPATTPLNIPTVFTSSSSSSGEFLSNNEKKMNTTMPAKEKDDMFRGSRKLINLLTASNVPSPFANNSNQNKTIPSPFSTTANASGLTTTTALQAGRNNRKNLNNRTESLPMIQFSKTNNNSNGDNCISDKVQGLNAALLTNTQQQQQQPAQQQVNTKSRKRPTAAASKRRSNDNNVNTSKQQQQPQNNNNMRITGLATVPMTGSKLFTSNVNFNTATPTTTTTSTPLAIATDNVVNPAAIISTNSTTNNGEAKKRKPTIWDHLSSQCPIPLKSAKTSSSIPQMNAKPSSSLHLSSSDISPTSCHYLPKQITLQNKDADMPPAVGDGSDTDSANEEEERSSNMGCANTTTRGHGGGENRNVHDISSDTDSADESGSKPHTSSSFKYGLVTSDNSSSATCGSNCVVKSQMESPSFVTVSSITLPSNLPGTEEDDLLAIKAGCHNQQFKATGKDDGAVVSTAQQSGQIVVKTIAPTTYPGTHVEDLSLSSTPSAAASSSSTSYASPIPISTNYGNILLSTLQAPRFMVFSNNSRSTISPSPASQLFMNAAAASSSQSPFTSLLPLNSTISPLTATPPAPAKF